MVQMGRGKAESLFPAVLCQVHGQNTVHIYFHIFNELRFVSELICSPLSMSLAFCIFFKQLSCT